MSDAAPQTHYARSGDVNIAYKVAGEGPLDLLFISGWFSHLDFMWELPQSRDFFSRLASRARAEGDSRPLAAVRRGSGGVGGFAWP